MTENTAATGLPFDIDSDSTDPASEADDDDNSHNNSKVPATIVTQTQKTQPLFTAPAPVAQAPLFIAPAPVAEASVATAPEAEKEAPKPLKCHVRGCLFGKKGEAPRVQAMKKCRNDECNKFAHYCCFLDKIYKSEWDGLEEEEVVCSRGCYDKHNKMNSDSRPSWRNDGPGGPNDHICSERILVSWLMKPGNYDQWKNGTGGTSKKDIAKELSALIKKEGVVVERTYKHVLDKIGNLEKSFKQAHNYATKETGAGVDLEQNPNTTFEALVEEVFPYYFELLPLMGGRASTKPHATSEDLSSDECEEEEGDDDDALEVEEIEQTPVSHVAEIEQTPINQPMNRTSGTAAASTTAASAKRVTIASSSSRQKRKISLLDDVSDLSGLYDAKEKVAREQAKNLALERENDKADRREKERLNRVARFQECESFLSTHSSWKKEKILRAFPEYAEFLDVLMDEEDSDSD